MRPSGADAELDGPLRLGGADVLAVFPLGFPALAFGDLRFLDEVASTHSGGRTTRRSLEAAGRHSAARTVRDEVDQLSCAPPASSRRGHLPYVA
ncbi:hypothetical protein ACIP6X_28170 [Streptomyces coeruleorubidus]|uniref:hypothetical protein n=1 Tax=Streptomyces coeruleorubidus TaxID=116188 RepID=UPI003825C45D